ncbi:hypothetical protein H2203_008195 [Taxawa tesnikishii (nom. ined.)]|nr:hypothetical protein H2203_008195 [Dothideales sp. JES 119]
MADTRPWITCHVLDTVAGKPGAGIDVTLTLISPAQDLASFSAKTNSDGRVTAWRSSDKGYFQELNSAIEYVKKDMSEGGQMVWSLKFDSGRYFGEGNTFWPEVELRFATKVNEAHYHVPLLLGPWSYTTYRGS